MIAQRPSQSDLFYAFLRIGLLSFGGPAAQISLMHRELVEERNWLTEAEFLNALSFCMLLPGPEAMQLATFAGWRMRGVSGGLIAGLLFVLPGAIVILLLASLYILYGTAPLVMWAFAGIKAAVIIIVLQALIRLSTKTLQTTISWGLAVSAFTAIFAFQVPFPIIIAIAGLIGALTITTATNMPAPAQIRLKDTIRTVVIWTSIWLVPLALLWASAPNSLLVQIGAFFGALAVVTFGGAYAVLAYMVQEVVNGFGWLTTSEMMDALGLAETTPGPLILVTQFVGFLAGAQEGGLWLGVAAALVVLWVTFVPCFLWIFAGAPYISWIASRPRLTGALAGISASVVGVIANLAIWFAMNVWFSETSEATLGPVTLPIPSFASLSPETLLLSLLAAYLTFIRNTNLLIVLPVMCGAGILTYSVSNLLFPLN